MGREQQLLEYFNELSPAEKDIAIGRVAEVYKGKVTELEAAELVDSMFSVEELADKISYSIRQLLKESKEEDKFSVQTDEYSRRRKALCQAAMETMEAMLSTDLFIKAAQRCQEDYLSTVIHNVPFMAESIAGRYERILNEIRN